MLRKLIIVGITALMCLATVGSRATSPAPPAPTAVAFAARTLLPAATSTTLPTSTATNIPTATDTMQPATLTFTPSMTPTRSTVFIPTLDEKQNVIQVTSLTHIVQQGEDLSSIAALYSVPRSALAAANGMGEMQPLAAGEVLLIPTTINLSPVAALPGATLTSTATITYTPTNRYSPTPTSSSIMFATPEPSSTPIAVVAMSMLPRLNSLPASKVIAMSEATQRHIRQIYACGVKRGNNTRAFSKIGDCNSENPHFLARFDSAPYNLGDYSYLQIVIDQFKGSFGRQGVAVHRGFHSWSAFDPMWADKRYCQPRESPIACEFRLNHPAIALIRLGTNDVGSPQYYEKNMRQIVEYAIAHGVIPVLGTKADRLEGQSNLINDIIRRIAADYDIPLWDFDAVAQTIPNSGLDNDGFHMTVFYSHDYSSPMAFLRGHGVQNLSALMALDVVWREAAQGGVPVTGCLP